MKKLNYTTITIIIILSHFLAFTCGLYANQKAVEPKAEETLNIQMYEAKDLTNEILESRADGTLIIEKVVGTVLDEELNGAAEGIENYYISYKSVEGVKKGDKVETYFVYNPHSQYFDDTIARIDFIL